MVLTLSVQHSFSHHSFSRTAHHLGKAERTDSLLYEKKLLEKQLVAETPHEIASPPLISDLRASLVAYEYQPAFYKQPSPSRAPPVL